MPAYEIECTHISKQFGDFVAVNDVSFSIAKGEIFGFLGPNGCGKSTTIRMVCGVLSPTSGQAFVGGSDVSFDPETVKQKIGYMSQKFSLYDDLTVSENLEFFAGMYGLHGRMRRQRIREVLGIAELEELSKALVSELSTGIRQRLALGASILHSPDILILDEPTSGVDPLSRRRFWDLIYALTLEGATVLVTTHSMDEAEHCHRVAMMHDGRLVRAGSPEELRTTVIQGAIYSVDCDPLFAALPILQDESGFEDVSVLGSKLHIRSGSHSPADIKLLLESKGIRVYDIEPGEATLEDAFVALTGAGS